MFLPHCDVLLCIYNGTDNCEMLSLLHDLNILAGKLDIGSSSYRRLEFTKAMGETSAFIRGGGGGVEYSYMFISKKLIGQNPNISIFTPSCSSDFQHFYVNPKIKLSLNEYTTTMVWHASVVLGANIEYLRLRS